jgi:DUF3025 family protein
MSAPSSLARACDQRVRLWDPEFFVRSPIFDPLQPAAISLRTVRERWPESRDYQRAVQASKNPVRNWLGRPIRFVDRGTHGAQSRRLYEPTIYLTGEVPTRPESWHDLFNALVWMTLPRTKAALNRRHFQALQSEQGRRGPLRDALTLFDESGVVAASERQDLQQLLRNHHWHELFWRNREAVAADLRFFVFGHGLLEKALCPYDGMTGQGIMLSVPRGFASRPLDEQLEVLDEALGEIFADLREASSRGFFCPVPVLGVPGWWAPNEEESYYANTRYFRPARGDRHAA